jgi:hypothetical protein
MAEHQFQLHAPQVTYAGRLSKKMESNKMATEQNILIL